MAWSWHYWQPKEGVLRQILQLLEDAQSTEETTRRAAQKVSEE